MGGSAGFRYHSTVLVTKRGANAQPCRHDPIGSHAINGSSSIPAFHRFAGRGDEEPSSTFLSLFFPFSLSSRNSLFVLLRRISSCLSCSVGSRLVAFSLSCPEKCLALVREHSAHSPAAVCPSSWRRTFAIGIKEQRQSLASTQLVLGYPVPPSSGTRCRRPRAPGAAVSALSPTSRSRRSRCSHADTSLPAPPSSTAGSSLPAVRSRDGIQHRLTTPLACGDPGSSTVSAAFRSSFLTSARRIFCCSFHFGHT